MYGVRRLYIYIYRLYVYMLVCMYAMYMYVDVVCVDMGYVSACVTRCITLCRLAMTCRMRTDYDLCNDNGLRDLRRVMQRRVCMRHAYARMRSACNAYALCKCMYACMQRVLGISWIP